MGVLENLGLSSAAKAKRLECIGGSDANIIMGGNADRLIKLWREKRGEAEPDNLDDILAVQMGSFTEPLNRAWYEKQTGNTVELVGEVLRNHDNGFPMGCTLDGVSVDPFGTRSMWEAKHVGVRSTDAEVFERYVPQLTHNSIVGGFDHAVLSAFKGNGDWLMLEYAVDGNYAAALIEAEENFWNCVLSGQAPAPLPAPPAPKPVGVNIVDMSGSNSWAENCASYLETLLASDRHGVAKAEIKALVPEDASEAFGHGVRVKRDKRGALRFEVL